MAVHFKFRSAVEYDSISIEGHFISITNLKEKIVEQKNLGKGTDFDLVITNAQTGEEYTDENHLLPKNTSVIIKRVPATRPKPTLLVHDQDRADPSEQTSNSGSKDSDEATQPPNVRNDDLDGLDDFGMDLYSIPEPATTHIDADENNKIVAMVTKTASDWKRQTQEAFASGRGYGRGVYGKGFARGRGYGRATPPPGYICHRCGQPGHFIQHCPTNGDPSYDMKRVKLPVGIPKNRLKADQEGSYILPDGSVAAMQPDETVFAKEADALLSVRPSMEAPVELRCTLCQGIFKEAVMIPCCHYSFCDKCIRQALIEKGKCPQCGSTKFKNDDLLPNLALRQAIERFLEAQLPTTSTDEGIVKQQPPADVESGTCAKVPSPALSGPKMDVYNPLAANMHLSRQEVTEKEPSPAVAAESVCESAVGSQEKSLNNACTNLVVAAKASTAAISVHIPDESEAVEGPALKVNDDVADHTIVKDVSGIVKEVKQHVNNIKDGAMISKMSEAPSHKEVEGVALESEVSKGKKKKKRARLIHTDGVAEHLAAGKLKKGDRSCYLCGSPEHLARDCMENAGPYPPPRAVFHPGALVPSAGIPPYGPEMYWHGPPMPHVRPFPMGYGEGIYCPGPLAMPFEAPMIPVGPYGVPPYMPPIYHNPPMHGGFMGGIGPGMTVPMERPLSREEFMELQERERQRRFMQECQERERSQERSYSREKGGQTYSPDSDRRFFGWRVSVEERQTLSRKRELDQHSVRNYSDEDDHYMSKSNKQNRKHSSERLAESIAHGRRESSSDDDVAYGISKSLKSHSERDQGDAKAMSSEIRKKSRHYRRSSLERFSSELEDGEHSYSARVRERFSKDGEHMRSSKQSSSKRYDINSKKHHRDNSKRSNDRSVHTEPPGGEDSHLSYHKGKRNVSEDSKHVSRGERKNFWLVGTCSEGLKSKEKYSTHGFSDHDDASAMDDEKHTRRKYQSYIKSKSDTGTVDYVSEDEFKKKKNKKYRGNSPDKMKDSNHDFLDGDFVHPSKHRKQKSNNSFQHIGSSTEKKKARSASQVAVSSMDDLIEESRWQMESGIYEEEDENSHHSHRSRHKHQHLQRGKSK